ncbi:MAG: UvrB/UvrC motif-containing protein, partial [Acidobacteria bacterium]|nr:UvrB/UvrC motif-containing protein [Acidobacteriota bacterium]
FLQMAQLDYSQVSVVAEEIEEYSSAEEIRAEMTKLETQMRAAAERFEFEKAAEYRDKIKRLKEIDLQLGFLGQRSDKQQK